MPGIGHQGAHGCSSLYLSPEDSSPLAKGTLTPPHLPSGGILFLYSVSSASVLRPQGRPAQIHPLMIYGDSEEGPTLRLGAGRGGACEAWSGPGCRLPGGTIKSQRRDVLQCPLNCRGPQLLPSPHKHTQPPPSSWLPGNMGLGWTQDGIRPPGESPPPWTEPHQLSRAPPQKGPGGPRAAMGPRTGGEGKGGPRTSRNGWGGGLGRGAQAF